MAYAIARLRGSTHTQIGHVDIVFPVPANSFSAHGRVLGAPSKEPATQSWIAQVASSHSGGAFWDVGANIGTFALFAAKLGLRVLAFEPLPPTFAYLQSAVSMNSLQREVVVLPFGLARTTEITSLAVRSLNVGVSGSLLGKSLSQPTDVFSALSVSGDDLLAIIPKSLYPTAIKIDTDGTELDILLGMTSLLQSKRLQGIMVEELASETNVESTLRRFGFTLSHEENTRLENPSMNVNRYFVRASSRSS